ncbi:MAG: TonB-dependent receptor [Paludibacteraceae bacterium]|nr:TonB-dependent receptor [Paludibacteraceae bacterium]
MLTMLCFFIAISFTPLTAQTQSTSTLSGSVKDAESHESLIGVSIYVEETKGGCVTDANGKYSLKLPVGEYHISISYVGYKSVQKKVSLNKEKETLNVLLANEETEMEEVVVTGRKKDANISEALMSSQRIQMVTVKKIPALMGEVDVVKAIQLMPGVQAASEGSSNFSVRGGNTDHNLILLDNATIYNASHMMGFFSVFNNDAVSEATLMKGDIPASYGGRLSSVLDVQTLNEMPTRFSGTGGIGLISSRLMLEVPLFDNRTSVMIAGRRTYADLFLPLAGSEYKDTYLYFFDLNAKITHKINDKNHLYLSGYWGRDNFGMEKIAGLGFGNKSCTFRWNHIYNKSLTSDFNITGSSYNYDMEIGVNPANFDMGAGMRDWNASFNLFKIWNPQNKTRAGLSGTIHRFNQGEISAGDNDDNTIQFMEDQDFGVRRSCEYGLFLSHEQKATKRLTLKYGLRMSIFHNLGEETVFKFDENHEKIDSTYYGSGKIFNTQINPEPRLGALYKIDKVSSVKASYSRTVQYAQMASNATGGLPFDIWLPSNPNIKPQKCDQYAIGYFRNLLDDKIETSVEVYYKQLRNVLDFKDNAHTTGNKYIDGGTRIGKGRSYGIELLAKKNTGKLTGWVSYTYSRSLRTVEEINFGKEYRSPFDRPHNFVAVLSFDFTKQFNLSANWVFNTGQPVTYPYGKYTVDNIPYAIYSGSRNQSRYPNYHRLDLSATLKSKEKKERRWHGEWNFSIYNAYGQHNTWAVMFTPDEDNQIKTEKMYLFTFVPSVSYNFKF